MGLTAEFTKKTVGRVAFRCSDSAAIAESRATGQGRTVECTSTGLGEAGDLSRYVVVQGKVSVS